ncbi:MAG: ABC transporter substrate-binding protein [Fulvimarina sp.]|nr:ABC transporter substrate-binding protein [Fulvimarina sp.]
MNRILQIVALTAGLFAASAAHAQEQVSVEIGYLPILPDAQLFVSLENGAFEKAGIEPDLVEFQEGPAMVQALLAGQLDAAYFGIGPAMVASARGADIKVVASNIVEQISFVAVGDLASFAAGGVEKQTFSEFAAKYGRKARISTFPTGSVPDTVLKYWLTKQLGASIDDIEIIHQGAAQVQQALLTGAVDGAAILEPAVSLALSRDADAKVLASGSQMFPGQPGAVLAVRSSLIKDHPEVVEAMVAAQRDATEALRDKAPGAAEAVAKYVGGGRLPLEVVREALDRSRQSFVADPNKIVDGTIAMRDFQKAEGTLREDVDVEKLIDTSFYDRLPAKDGQGAPAKPDAAAQ